MEDRSMPNATLEDFETIISQTDPNEPKGSEGWRAKLMLLSSLKVGQDPGVLADFTKLPIAEIGLFVQRLCDNGIWIGGEWVNFNPWRGADSGVDLDICVNVALGFMAYDATKDTLQMTAQGKARVEHLTRENEG